MAIGIQYAKGRKAREKRTRVESGKVCAGSWTIVSCGLRVHSCSLERNNYTPEPPILAKFQGGEFQPQNLRRKSGQDLGGTATTPRPRRSAFSSHLSSISLSEQGIHKRNKLVVLKFSHAFPNRIGNRK